MFRRNFFVWLFFFVFCLSLVSGVALFDRWRATQELESAQAHLMTARISADLIGRLSTHTDPDKWDWNRLHRSWTDQFPSLQGIALEDRADGRVTWVEGEFDKNWIPVYGDGKNSASRWLTLNSNERVWVVLPAGVENPRFRLWVNLGTPTTLGAYLERRRYILAGEFALFLLFFIAFFWRVGSPARHIKPMVATLGRALERADSPLQVPLSRFPGEFVPLGKAISLLLEARRTEHEERERLFKRVGMQTRQKDQYARMIESLETDRDHEQTAAEQIQSALLEANRDPAILLDRTQRILSMNDSARRILSLSGQTGYPIRHSEIEAILEAHLHPCEDSSKDRRVSIRDPFKGKSSLWNVEVSIHRDWKDPDQIQLIIVSLHRDNATQSSSAQSPEHLLRLMAEAWAESWTSGAETPHPLSEEERSLLDTLIRDLHAPGARAETSHLVQAFGVQLPEGFELNETLGEPSGTLEGWRAFGRWFAHVLENSSTGTIRTRLIQQSSGRLKIEWTSDEGFSLKEWFTADHDRTRSFRREALSRCLEKLRAKLRWDPTDPQSVRLEILLKIPLVTGRPPPGIPLKAPA